MSSQLVRTSRSQRAGVGRAASSSAEHHLAVYAAGVVHWKSIAKLPPDKMRCSPIL